MTFGYRMMPQRASSCIFLQEFDERFLFHWKFSGGIINSVQNLKEDVMLEKIMDLHILLYSMAALGGLEQWECWRHILLTED